MSGVVWFELSKSGKWREGPSEPPSGMVARLVQSKRSKVISDKFAKKMLKRREESMLFTRGITREGGL